MTSLLLVLSLFSLKPNAAIADSTPLKSVVYLVRINKNTPDASKGYLQQISDTSLRLTLYRQPYGYITSGKTVLYRDVNNLSIHRGGWAVRGAIWGALGGAAVGAIVGVATYEPCTGFCLFDIGIGGTMILVAILGLWPGALVGLGINSRKRRFKIGGKKENFEQMRSKLLRVYGNKEYAGRK